MKALSRPHVGCSGWNYKSWRSTFYPAGVPASRWLEFYATRFCTVEINNTFYRLPERQTFENWRKQVPPTFLFAVKASRFLTHMKRLRDPEEPIARLFSRIEGLKGQTGPVLYQLPGNFTIDLTRLDDFLSRLPRRLNGRRLRHVVEFRHPSWYVPETFAVLQNQRVALCLHDKRGSEIAESFVGPFTYVRFHGTSGHYHGSYSLRELNRWVRRLSDQVRSGREVFAYFNNDPDATAVTNALMLRSALETLI